VVVISVTPRRVVPRGRVSINGAGLLGDALPDVWLGDTEARVVFASPRRVVVTVPDGIAGGHTAIRCDGWPAGDVEVGATWVTGVHQVDSPVFDRDGNLYVTYSGSRGQESPVSIFRVTRDGTREPFASGIVNPTSMAIGPDQRLYVSSRFEGAVYRMSREGKPEQVASDLGVACGIAFDREGVMHVGDRSGTVFQVRDGRATVFATLPSSVAAFHLAMAPDDTLYVTAPTLGTYDPIYRVDREGHVTAVDAPLGRPQGIACGPDGRIYVADALAGASGIYRLRSDDTLELMVSGEALVGVAFHGHTCVVSSNDTVYRFA
jgi:sugar lactone lactonase YvrE